MIDSNKLKFRLQYIEKEMTNISIEQIKEYIEETKVKWQELIEQGKKIREKEILNYHKNEIPNDTDDNKKKQKQIIKRIEKEKSVTILFGIYQSIQEKERGIEYGYYIKRR